MVRKIACATDFSPGARVALLAAARLAKQVDAELEIVHAWALPTTGLAEGFAFPPSMIDQMVTDSQQGLDAAAATAREAGVARVHTKLLEGGAWEAVTSELERDPSIDLVVVGTHGRTGLSRIVLGSVAQRIVRLAPCSVLVVRASSQISAFDHIACPIDFSEDSQYAIDLAGSLANPGGRGLTLLHAFELPITFESMTGYADVLADLDRQASRRLDEWTARARDRVTVPVTAQMRTGAAASQLLAMLDADPSFALVVIGSHSRTGLRRLLLGSVAERVVGHAKPPVLVARRRTHD